MTRAEIRQIAAQIRTGDRRQLARAITRAESRRTADRQASNALLDELLADTGKAIRIGISGTPGVGKSTLIETLGQHLCDRGQQIAVLSVDPSSTVSGGSILGDKTRMPGLSGNARAYIRPSPAAGALGGVTARMRESILLCEAAGFDAVLVETVGVGQSECAASAMTDLLLLLLLPSGGDGLQGLKRGIVELADFILINKADGQSQQAAQQTAGDYRAALRILHAGGDDEFPPEVHALSALTPASVQTCWQKIRARWQALHASGQLQAKRARQRRSWLREEMHQAILRQITDYAEHDADLAALEKEIDQNRSVPGSAVEQFFSTLKIVRQ